MDLKDLDDGLAERIMGSCLQQEPGTVGILVHGSYAIGDAHRDSDLDLLIFAEGGVARAEYRTWFQERSGIQPLHVSARCGLTLSKWREEEGVSEDWALGLAVELPHVWLLAEDRRLVQELGARPVLRKPQGSPEVEDLVEAALKMRRCLHSGDELGLRLFGQQLARCAAPTIAALNSPRPVSSPREALDRLRRLPVVPAGWESDLLTCLGLLQASSSDVASAGERLGISVLRLVREINPDVDSQPDIARYVLDGTLEHLLEGLTG